MRKILLIGVTLLGSASLVGCGDESADLTISNSFSAYNLKDNSVIKLSYSNKNNVSYEEAKSFEVNYKDLIEFDEGKSVSLGNNEYTVSIIFKGFDSDKFVIEDMYFTDWDSKNILPITEKSITLNISGAKNFVFDLYETQNFIDFFMESNLKAKLHIFTLSNIFTFDLYESLSVTSHDANGKNKDDYTIYNSTGFQSDSWFNFKSLDYSSSLSIMKRGLEKLCEIKAEKYNVLTYVDFKYSIVACCEFDLIEGYVYSGSNSNVEKEYFVNEPISFSGAGDCIDISFLNRKYFIEHNYALDLAIVSEEGYMYISICRP